MENKEEVAAELETTWKSCCVLVDRSAVVFFSTLSISLIVIAFCIFQLIRLEDCQSQSTYLGLLGLIIGVWLKSPTFK